MSTKLSDYEDEMMRFLGEVYDATKNGEYTKENFVWGFAQILAALSEGNLGEAVAAFKAGADRFKPLRYNRYS